MSIVMKFDTHYPDTPDACIISKPILVVFLRIHQTTDKLCRFPLGMCVALKRAGYADR